MLLRTSRSFVFHLARPAPSTHALTANAAASKRMVSHVTPPWLSSLLSENNPAPKLYAWTPAHLGHSTKLASSSTESAAKDDDDANRRIYILGLGNLGRMYALYLRTRANPPPITLIVHRKELLTQWHQSNGIEITYKDQVQTCKDFDIEWWTEQPPTSSEHTSAAAAAAPIREAADGRKIRNLFVTTKAPAALPQVDRMRRYLDAQSTVAFAQNGMSRLWPPTGAAYMAARFPAGAGFNAILCVTNHGLYAAAAAAPEDRHRPFHSVFAAPADAYLGPVLLQNTHSPPPSTAYLTEQVTSTPVLAARAFSSLDVWVLQLEKLVVNMCINPLSAILRCRTGGLFATTEERSRGGGAGAGAGAGAGVPEQVMDLLLAPASQVLQRLVADPSSMAILETDSRGRGIETIRAELRERFALDRLRAMLRRAGVRVGANKSSMLQDVEAGKPTTEVRDFNGWVVDMAAHLGGGIDVSAHEKMIDLVERRVVMNEQQLAQHFLVIK